MKKILFLVVFMVFSSFAAMAVTPDLCSIPADPAGNCKGCNGGTQQSTCCTINGWIGSMAKGCRSTNSPINQGLIFLLIAGIGLGAFVVYKNNRLKLV